MNTTQQNIQSSISFLTDNNGMKRGVVFDLQNEEVKELMEDLFDTIVATERINEPASSLAQVKKNLLRKKQAA